ncbi:UNVERIFIED_CONTAM: hypothetical protein K2H54_006087 [Gekko kuhli]
MGMPSKGGPPTFTGIRKRFLCLPFTLRWSLRCEQEPFAVCDGRRGCPSRMEKIPSFTGLVQVSTSSFPGKACFRNSPGVHSTTQGLRLQKCKPFLLEILC